MGENVRFKSGHARVETRVLKTLACRKNSEKSLGVHKIPVCKIWFYPPPPPKRAQNEEKLYKSVENPQN